VANPVGATKPFVLTTSSGAYGRTHDVPNLFIVDASALPSQGAGDSPSLTIQAFAFRAADYIASLVRRREL